MNKIEIDKTEMNKNIIFIPYKIKIVKRTINGETVWHSNKFKNFLLKMKFFFIKPKYAKNAEKYSKKIIDSSKYEEIKLTNN